MLTYRGQSAEHIMVCVNRELRNPYDAVEEVYVNSARPLKETDRIDFITENLVLLDELCEAQHNDWLAVTNPLPRPTHAGTPTLH